MVWITVLTGNFIIIAFIIFKLQDCCTYYLILLVKNFQKKKKKKKKKKDHLVLFI